MSEDVFCDEMIPGVQPFTTPMLVTAAAGAAKNGQTVHISVRLAAIHHGFVAPFHS
jgi:hypothetical protein